MGEGGVKEERQRKREGREGEGEWEGRREREEKEGGVKNGGKKKRGGRRGGREREGKRRGGRERGGKRRGERGEERRRRGKRRGGRERQVISTVIPGDKVQRLAHMLLNTWWALNGRHYLGTQSYCHTSPTMYRQRLLRVDCTSNGKSFKT